MTILGGIGFTAPWLLIALAALPILWFILRAIPPAPIRRRFPGVALLLGLTDDDTVTDRTPWWLLLLRILAVAAVILGLAGPVLNPETNTQTSDRPLLIVTDGSWAGAAGWGKSRDAALLQLEKAGQNGRSVALLNLADPAEPVFQATAAIAERLAALDPKPWQPSEDMVNMSLGLIRNLDATDTLWVSDGIAFAQRDALIGALQDKGEIIALQGGLTPMGLRPATYTEGLVQIDLVRPDEGPERDATVLAHGTDPAGNTAILARLPVVFEAGETVKNLELSLPAEMRARVTHFALEGHRSAGATSLVDDNLRRREVALVSGREDREGLQLLLPLHYLEQALAPHVDLIKGQLTEILPANPDVIVLADIATLSASETDDLQAWADAGGMLLRFAGPRTAASDVSRAAEDPLMPVRLRSGGRSVGGAMSWGEPKALSEFDETSPFYGLSIPQDVRITAQVMAQPDPQLAERVIAQLTDGTPLITRKPIGLGQVVLFHVTANAEWSNLPLSVLFVQLLERLSVVSGASTPTPEDLEGTIWTVTQVLDGFGSLSDARGLGGIDGADMLAKHLGPDVPPGVYQSENRAFARNVIDAEHTLEPATWPANVTVIGLDVARTLPLGGLLLAMALILLMIDVVASLALSGKLIGPRVSQVATLVIAVLFIPHELHAQTNGDEFAVQATAELALGHVLTGDAQIDEIAEAGLRGLSDALYFRTSVEPSSPMGVDLETDELSFFPVLYWPITTDQPRPSADAYAKLNTYLRSGGLILFDTRDADLAGLGATSPNGRKLQQLAAPLDVPRLEPVPNDHVLTRTFYLLQDFPGRHAGRNLWVEAAPPDAAAVDGMPFRNLNDGVTPVVIGGNDWASAWAVNESGAALLPIGRGFAGERQRELAYRFGINLVMHVLTGNYKSDQVHVPALLDRLGQ